LGTFVSRKILTATLPGSPAYYQGDKLLITILRSIAADRISEKDPP
jgi:hypothetical protein